MGPGTSEPPVLELLEVSIDPPAPLPDTTPAPPARRLVVVVGVIAALATGAGFLALRPNAGAAPALATPPSAPTAPGPHPAGIEGFAELYVASYLSGEGGRALRRFYAAAPDVAAPAATRFVRQIATLSVTPDLTEGWDVLLAADVLVHDGVGYLRQGLHHYTVGVVDTPTGFAATALPLLVPPPPPAPIPAGQPMAPLDDAALTALVEGFLAAYLTGVGDLQAFLAPKAGISAITPAPFERVALDELQGAAGDDGTIWVRALGTARDQHGALAIELHLVVSGDGGTWAIERLDTGGPPPASD